MSESVKKKKNCDENLFLDNFEWSSKNLSKMMSANVKANIKQQELKDLVAVSYIFLRSTLNTWNTV